MPTKSDLVARARELAPIVASEAANTESAGRVPQAIIDAFCDAGFMKIFVPKRFGGYEMSYDTMSEVVGEIAPYCTSTAWTLAFYIGHNFIHALFPERSQQEVFAPRSFALTPGTATPTFTLTRTEGGYIAEGRSSWNSGSAQADWFMCGGIIPDAIGGPEMRLFMVPAQDVRVIDNWDVAGMKGTSSCDITVSGAFIPEYHTVEASSIIEGKSPGSLLHANPIYSLPLLPFILGEVMPVVVGAYRGALSEFQKLTEKRILTHTADKAAEKQTAQIRLGKGIASCDLAQDMLLNYTRMIMATDAEQMRKPETRARIRARCALINDYCCNGVNELMLGAGAAAFRNDSPLQRIFRDMNMLHVHGYLDLEAGCQALGRVTLGMAPQCPI